MQIAQAHTDNGSAPGNREKHAVILAHRIMRLGLIHDPGNDVFNLPVAELSRNMTSIFDEEGMFRLSARDGGIFVNRSRLKQDVTNTQACEYISQRFNELRIGGIELLRPPIEEEVKRFLVTLAKLPPPAAEKNGVDCVDEKLMQLDLDAFTAIEAIEATMPVEREVSRVVRITDLRERSIALYERTLDFIKKTLSESSQSPASIRRAKRLVHQFVDISAQQGGDFSLTGLTAIKNYDDYTYNHSVNVCVLSIAFGQKLGLSNTRLAELGVGALFHDLGKISIPKEVLNKAGTLSADEWELMKKHPVNALKNLFAMHGFTESGIKKVLVALEHHMNFDLSGYPRFIIEKKMHLYSRIVSIVDAFDAMTTQRIYQKAMRPDMVLKLMLEYSGRRYDPLLLKAFIMSVGLYPAGTLVLLNNGSIAVVIKPNSQPRFLERPLLRIIGRFGRQEKPVRTVDLGSMDLKNLWIVKSLDPEAFNINIPHYLLYA